MKAVRASAVRANAVRANAVRANAMRADVVRTDTVEYTTEECRIRQHHTIRVLRKNRIRIKNPLLSHLLLGQM